MWKKNIGELIAFSENNFNLVLPIEKNFFKIFLL